MPLTCRLVQNCLVDDEYYYTIVVLASTPMPKSPGGFNGKVSDWYLEDPGSIPGYIGL